MKVFFLRLGSENFTTKSGNTWTTSTIDLYQNDSYLNYSTTKSNYGSDLLGNGVWTGLDVPSGTDGFVYSGRYVDTTGRVDIVSYNQEIVNSVGSGNVSTTLQIYTSHSSTAIFPEEWAPSDAFDLSSGINIVDSARFIRVRANFSHPDNVVFDPIFYIRIEIDVPIIAPLYQETRTVLNKLPQWMSMRNIGTHPNAYLATPNSLGGKLVNTIAGEWIDKIGTDLNTANFNRYIGSVDLNQKSWVWKANAVPEFPYSITGDNVELSHTCSLDEFFETTEDEDAFFWAEENSIIYFNKQYTSFQVNGQTFDIQPQLLWGPLDELGLAVDLERLELENNLNFRLRILDVHKNPPGVGSESFKNALRRELDIWRAYGSTPDSSFQGATPEILEIKDVEKDPIYVDQEGIPTNRFVDLVENNLNLYPTTWSHFKWDKAVWDLGGEKHEGFSTLPNRMDATPYIDSEMQAGVGDDADLFVFHPSVITGPRDVNLRLRARGRRKVPQTQYPPVELSFYVYGQGSKTVYNNPTNLVWVTVEIQTFDVGNPTYFYSVQLSNTSNVNNSNPTSTSETSLTFFDEGGSTTATNIAFAHKVTGVSYGGNGIIPVSNIKKVSLFSGKWNIAATPGYILGEGTDSFVAYFSNDLGETLLYNTSLGSVPSYDGVNGSPQLLPRSKVILKSKETSSSVQTWISDKVPATITMNNASPPTGPLPVTFYVPNIVFDPYVTGPSKQYVIELNSSNNMGAYGGYATMETGFRQFLNYSYFQINGSNSWSANKKLFPFNTQFVTFTVGSGPLYPVASSTWDLFEATQTVPFSGTVDENGPYNNGEPSQSGSSNLVLTSLNPNRAAFGIPNTSDYVITWLGVDVLSGDSVIAWMDSNTVNPVEQTTDVVYPLNAIEETLASGIYSYGPFTVKARIRTIPDSHWLPQIHSGYFYQNEDEYYLYADDFKEQALAATPNGTEWILSGGNYQGAPIIVTAPTATPIPFRQVVGFSSATPDSSGTAPTTLSLTYTEIKAGTGATPIYAAYEDIYNINVLDLTTGQSVPTTSSSTTSNRILTTSNTNADHEYKISYTVNNSFVVDNEYLVGATPQTKLIFDKPPASLGVSHYDVVYESSRFDPATPVYNPLNPQYTSLEESFLFVSYNEYTLDRVELRVSPSVLIADGYDYLVVTVRTLDSYDNPKPYQTVNLTTSFGNVSPNVVTTDHEGYASATVTSVITTSTPNGTINATVNSPSLAVSTTFDVDIVDTRDGRLLASVGADQIPADHISTNIVVGRVDKNDLTPQPYAYVNWKRARSLFDVLSNTGTPTYTGTVTADVNGVFNVGPFTSSTPNSGYWFVSMESNSASPSGTFDAVGDVVVWYEYPSTTYGVENFSGLPRSSVQSATPYWDYNYPAGIPPYSPINQFPGNYDEATPHAPATPNRSNNHMLWTLPKWFAIPKYVQYQLGLLGDTIHRDVVDLTTALQHAVKDRKWL